MKRNPLVALLALSAALFLWACGGSSSAGPSGDTDAQVLADIASAVAPLNAKIASLSSAVSTLQAEVPHNLIITSSGVVAHSVGMRTYGVTLAATPATSTAPTIVGTFLGPTSGSVIGMTQQVGISSTNYLFISAADGSGNNSAGFPSAIFFESSDCSGPAFTVLAAGLSQANVTQGVVFGVGAIGDTDASDYLMLPAGETSVAEFANSEVDAPSSAIGSPPPCVKIVGGPNNYPAAFELTQNVQATSGIPSGPFSSTSIGP